MDRALLPMTRALLAVAAPRPGDRVLDVGCGAGATTRMLRELSGAGGAALGVDISQPLVTQARAQGGDVQYVVADAASYELPRGAFQMIFSRFGVMFFDDPKAAFTNLHRGLAPEGRLAFVCWRAPAENPWGSAPLAAARDLLPPSDPPPADAPGPFAFADRSRITAILEGAGYHDIAIAPHDDVMWLADSLDDALANVLEIGPLARAAAELDAATQLAIKQRVRGALAPFIDAAGAVSPPAAVWLVTARK
jgi:SAM-dependent methyltransferase